ncbi:tRNA pseudouridine(38-40) synthase TruA [Hydrogenobacter hydrogenophilus]|uniref:tRNA pseudouridine synthase A n=1 Tax=Hydrogenobacter hydrogenophilus TaxID=35835 RepID=A0A285P350_9AQUI|nr:tRNA pseudouridine(38-40) synthase TruA [Hydrogenobacter hydrogenophilus]SNZ16179.1 tRNA pseudouridine38-40 synthase [Hydrogenobacter hydrogenophilus]
MPNYVLLLSYVGTNFHGWQIQPNLRTVQGVLKENLQKMFKEEIKLIGCCRTDAGVHAKEFVANFSAQKEIKPEQVLKALNSMLPQDIGIKKVWIQEGFNARYSVKGKVYLYRILNSHSRDAFIEPFVWRIPTPLDFSLMQKASSLFLGRRDFSAFAKIDDEEKNTLIELEDVKLSKLEELIEIRIRAKSFLRYMVRRIVGSLVQLGLGKIKEEDIQSYLRNEKHCPFTAKAKGLTLERVIL